MILVWAERADLDGREEALRLGDDWALLKPKTGLVIEIPDHSAFRELITCSSPHGMIIN